jgi:hypothetical protein
MNIHHHHLMRTLMHSVLKIVRFSSHKFSAPLPILNLYTPETEKSGEGYKKRRGKMNATDDYETQRVIPGYMNA